MSICQILFENTINFALLRSISKSEWTKSDVETVVLSGKHDDIIPIMHCIPEELLTEDIWVIAVAKYPDLFVSILPCEFSTHEFYLRVVTQAHFIPTNLAHIPMEARTPQLCEAFIRRAISLSPDGNMKWAEVMSLIPSESQTKQIIELVVCSPKSRYSFKSISNQTKELCIRYLKWHPTWISDIREQTIELCVIALENVSYYPQYRDVINGIKIRIDPIYYLQMIQRYPISVGYIGIQNNNYYSLVIRQAKLSDVGTILSHIRIQTPTVCLAAYDRDANCVNVVDGTAVTRTLMRIVIARRMLALHAVGLSVALMTEIYAPLQATLFPLKPYLFYRRLSSVQLWDLFALCKRL